MNRPREIMYGRTLADLVRVCAPVYLKFGLRNAPNIYPSGTHLEAMAVALTKERVRRAKIGLDLLQRLDSEAVMSSLLVGHGILSEVLME